MRARSSMQGVSQRLIQAGPVRAGHRVPTGRDTGHGSRVTGHGSDGTTVRPGTVWLTRYGSAPTGWHRPAGTGRTTQAGWHRPNDTDRTTQTGWHKPDGIGQMAATVPNITQSAGIMVQSAAYRAADPGRPFFTGSPNHERFLQDHRAVQPPRRRTGWTAASSTRSMPGSASGASR